MKKENFYLNLKSANEVKAFDVEMQFDEDAENDKFSMHLDNEEIELTGDTESILMKLSKLLKDKYEIHSCYTCRYGNFNPIGNMDNEIFCVNDFKPKCKADLLFICEDIGEQKKRRRTLFDVCESFKPCSDDYYTYK